MSALTSSQRLALCLELHIHEDQFKAVEQAVMSAVVRKREKAKYSEAEGEAFADGYFTAEVEQSADAARYRKLRDMFWDTSPLAVVRDPRNAVKLGHDCPSGARLDALLDVLP